MSISDSGISLESEGQQAPSRELSTAADKGARLGKKSWGRFLSPSSPLGTAIIPLLVITNKA